MRNNSRQGKVLVFVALLLVVLIGSIALAIDIGLIMFTRTQLQSSSDSGSLAAGTELLSGLGFSAFRTPAEVKAVAGPVAVEFVGKHPAAESATTHIEAARDVQFGKASLNIGNGTWTFQWGVTPYNAVGVSTHRSDTGTTAGDKPLPLIFARIFGREESNVDADSVAVILPASGIRITPDTGVISALSPFAFEAEKWEKYFRARDYFVDNGLTAADLSIANGGDQIVDTVDGTPLFYEMVEQGNTGTFNPRPLFTDTFGVTDPDRHDAANITTTPDGVLEANIYPLNNEPGNFGTVDIGDSGNSTADLVRQIKTGISYSDLANFPNGTFDPDPSTPVTLEGDTGISAGIESALQSIKGQCRSIVLYSQVSGSGNNAQYEIIEMVGIRIMNTNFSGKNKVLIVQPCSLSDPAGIPDFEEEIDEDTTLFTPLILAR